MRIHATNAQQAYERMNVGDTYVIPREDGQLPKDSRGWLLEINLLLNEVYGPKEFSQEVCEDGLRITRLV